MSSGRLCLLNLFHELGLQAHCTEAIDFAVDVVVAVDQSDILHFGAHFYDAAGPFQLQILDDGYGIAILQDVPGRIAVDAFNRFGLLGGLLGPFM